MQFFLLLSISVDLFYVRRRVSRVVGSLQSYVTPWIACTVSIALHWALYHLFMFPIVIEDTSSMQYISSSGCDVIIVLKSTPPQKTGIKQYPNVAV